MFFLILFSGCQPRSDRWSAGRTFKTQIIVSTSQGTRFQEVELEGVFNKSTLEGEIADFYFAPGDEKGQLVGNKPLARFIEDDDVHVPVDQTSLQMVTLYYHLQELKKMELEALQSNRSLLKWPRKVALSVQVLNAPDMKYDNAFYSAKTDALYFVPYTLSAFPIPLNPGIIAHEFFHSYFAYEVLNPLLSKSVIRTDVSVRQVNDEQGLKDLYNLYVLKIMNEGLADFWGWVYSNDPDFVAVSLPTLISHGRTLDKVTGESNLRLVSETNLKKEILSIIVSCVNSEQKCVTDNAYSHGSVLARALKAFTMQRMKSHQASRKIVVKQTLNMIQDIQKQFAEKGTFNLDQALVTWEKQFDNVSDLECKILEQTASSPGVLKCASSSR